MGNVLGVAAAAVAAALAYGAHEVVPQVGVLTWAVGLGVVVANLGQMPRDLDRGVRLVTRRALRLGVVLLGLSLSIGAILDLGPRVIALVVVTLAATLVATTWLGQRMGLDRPRSLLIGTGFAICGASAIAAMEENAEADEEDVAVAIAMVTICGTVAMVVLPLLQHPLGLSSTQYGAWAGASVHEVGQVVAAAGPAGSLAVSVAVVVKLTRVLMLAPAVALVSVGRRCAARRLGESETVGRLPPLVPLFVLGFLVCVSIRSTGLIPSAALPSISTLQDLILAAALFGMGTAVSVRSLVKSSGGALLLSVTSTVVIASISLGGVLLLV